MRYSRLSVAGLSLALFAAVCTAQGQSPPAATPPPVPVPMVAPPAQSSPFAGYPNLYSAAGALTVASNDPAMAKEMELDREATNLARQYAKNEDRAERSKIKDKLNDVLQQQFDAQQARRKAEIEKIEDRLKKLRELMQKRQDAKSTIVQRRLDQLMQDAEGLGWTTMDPTAPTGYVPPRTGVAGTAGRR